MIQVDCVCGASYSLKDELAGKKVKCPTCGEVAVAGGSAAKGAFSADLDPVFQRDKFLLRQKHLAIGEKYYVWDEQGEVLLFVERPAHFLQSLVALFGAIGALIVVGGGLGALASVMPAGNAQGIVGIVAGLGGLAACLVAAIALSPKRHVNFYRDDTKSRPMLTVLQDKKAQLITATYTVLDVNSKPIARLQKNYLYNIFRKRWYIVEAESDRVIALALEDSLILSMLRRLIGPMLGLLRTNFIITEGESDRVIGEFNRKFTLLDRYVLDMTPDRGQHLDRRVAVALGLMLDTGEKR
jgi:uncharacterized protein YxjI